MFLSIQIVAVVLHHETTTNTQRNDTHTDVHTYEGRARVDLYEH